MDKSYDFEIKAGDVSINGSLSIPPDTSGIVIFAHGSGSGRFSPRNRFVAEKLNSRGLSTLLIDLLTEEEEIEDEVTREYRFNIDLLAERLVYATHFTKTHPNTQDLPVGYFGASTGAAAALVAAARLPKNVQTIVSRGGRPDLAGDALKDVETPVLFVVGEEDREVIKLNEEAMNRMTNAKFTQLAIIPGATHLFEEPGALGQVASKASDWFLKYL